MRLTSDSSRRTKSCFGFSYQPSGIASLVYADSELTGYESAFSWEWQDWPYFSKTVLEPWIDRAIDIRLFHYKRIEGLRGAVIDKFVSDYFEASSLGLSFCNGQDRSVLTRDDCAPLFWSRPRWRNAEGFCEIEYVLAFRVEDLEFIMSTFSPFMYHGGTFDDNFAFNRLFECKEREKFARAVTKKACFSVIPYWGPSNTLMIKTPHSHEPILREAIERLRAASPKD